LPGQQNYRQTGIGNCNTKGYYISSNYCAITALPQHGINRTLYRAKQLIFHISA